MIAAPMRTALTAVNELGSPDWGKNLKPPDNCLSVWSHCSRSEGRGSIAGFCVVIQRSIHNVLPGLGIVQVDVNLGAKVVERVIVFAPLVVGLILFVLATWCIARSFRPVQLLLGLPVVAMSLWSIWVTKNILNGAWPTFLPHVAVAAAVPLALIQVGLVRRRSRKRTSRERST